MSCRQYHGRCRLAWRCRQIALIFEPSLRSEDHLQGQLQLAMWQLCSGHDAAAASHQARLLLSQLSAEAGFDLSLSGWSRRGTGRPRHPDMPAGWHASISHRQGRIVVALADCPLGIDLECWQSRHSTRLYELVELLPEAHIQRQIRHSASPQRSFYKAYTLHEALYKLASANTQPVEGLFETRLADIRPSGKLFAWQWEDPQWTLSIVTSQDRVAINLPALPQTSDSTSRLTCPDKLAEINSRTHSAESWQDEVQQGYPIALQVSDACGDLSESLIHNPAIRRFLLEAN